VIGYDAGSFEKRVAFMPRRRRTKTSAFGTPGRISHDASGFYKTKTSAFGTPGRISHDASGFYKSALFADAKPAKAVSYLESPIPPERLDTLYCKSSEKMDEIPDASVHLMVTSPPYNVQKEYDQDLSIGEYRELLRAVFAETFCKLATGGKACINVANLGRKPPAARPASMWPIWAANPTSPCTPI
jgi:hypothetical protein